MRDVLVKALTSALELKPEPAVLTWPVAVLAAAFFGLLLFAVFQYQTSERRWGMKLVLGLVGGATVVGLGTSAFHWITGLLYGVGYLLTWLVWVLTRRWSWWRRALARGLTAGLTLGPWLWLGATEKERLRLVSAEPSEASALAEWLLTPSALVWFWMLLGVLWLMVVVGGWGCWRWPLAPVGRRRWLVATWAVLGVLGLNWFAAGRVDSFAVCEKGQHWRLGYILLSRPGSQWYRNNMGHTPLHLAARWGGTEALRLLLAAGADVRVNERKGESPLHWAARWGKSEALRLLLEAGGDGRAKDNGGRTPLHLAAFAGNAEALRLLLEAGSDGRAKDNGGQTPLHWAARWGNAEALRLLLVAGADVRAKDSFGRTPLHAAAGRNLLAPSANAKVAAGGNAEVIRVLLAAGAGVKERDRNGESPLHWAARCCEAEAIRLLLAAGALVDERTKSGRTALDLANDGSGYWSSMGTALSAANDACREVLRQAGGKTGAELDAEKAVPAPATVPQADPATKPTADPGL